MELIEGIETRRSIRAFKDTPIAEETLNKILEAASHSPSYTNTQPWEVAVVCGKKKADLSKTLCDLTEKRADTHSDLPMPKNWPSAHETRAKEHGARRMSALGVERDDAEEREKLRVMNFKFYGAPCAVFLLMDGSLGEWSIFDMGLFTQNLILAAHAFGVESCLQASVTNYAQEIKTFLGLAENKKMVICISMGYPDNAARLNTYHAIKEKPEAFTKWFT